jgi:dTDP-4-amino-4,6-dideoxygalactose transaminase
MEALQAIADKHGLKNIEDACQAVAATCRGRAAGSFGMGIFYPVPAHQQGDLQEIVGQVALPVAERMAKEVLSLPVHPQVSQADLEIMVREVNKL